MDHVPWITIISIRKYKSLFVMEIKISILEIKFPNLCLEIKLMLEWREFIKLLTNSLIHSWN